MAKSITKISLDIVVNVWQLHYDVHNGRMTSTKGLVESSVSTPIEAAIPVHSASLCQYSHTLGVTPLTSQVCCSVPIHILVVDVQPGHLNQSGHYGGVTKLTGKHQGCPLP